MQRTFLSKYRGLICGLNLNLVLALLGVLDNSFLCLGSIKFSHPLLRPIGTGGAAPILMQPSEFILISLDRDYLLLLPSV